MIRALARSLAPASIPTLSRASYRHELWTSSTFPVAVSLTEGAVAGYLAAQVFHASELQVAIITAAAMFTNLSSALWAYATRGRRKVASIASMMAGTIACVAGVAFLPLNEFGAWSLVVLTVLAHTLRVGMITVRSTIWRHNYPRSQRGRITGRLAMVVNLVLLIAPTLGSLILELDSDYFRILFFVSACVGMVGVLRFARIRLRGERALLRYENRPGTVPTRHGDAVGIYEFTANRRDSNPGMWAILRQDPMFRRYMLWQFIAGVSAMMIEPVLILIAAKETQGIHAGAFVVGLALTHGLPTFFAVISLPLWAAKLDRMHVVKFRVGQSWLWTVSQLIVWIGAIWLGPTWAVIAILCIGRVVLGIARGGGTLAWNLGHNDFASREMVAAYMGVHVTLTGIRGAFAPFLGVALYSGFMGIPGIGGHVFFLSAILSLISVLGFRAMDRKLKRTNYATPSVD